MLPNQTDSTYTWSLVSLLTEQANNQHMSQQSSTDTHSLRCTGFLVYNTHAFLPFSISLTPSRGKNYLLLITHAYARTIILSLFRERAFFSFLLVYLIYYPTATNEILCLFHVDLSVCVLKWWCVCAVKWMR